jgi:hypothetical protein
MESIDVPENGDLFAKYLVDINVIISTGNNIDSARNNFISELLHRLSSYLSEELVNQKNNVAAISLLEREITLTNDEIDNYVAQKAMLTLNKKNPLANFIYHHFSRKYRENLALSETYSREINSLITLLDEKQKKLSLQKSQHNPSFERQLTESLASLSDRKKAISVLLQRTPHLCENDVFMTSLLNEGLEYIHLDRTNNPSLYIKFIELFNEKIERDFDKQLNDKIINEIKSPQQPSAGMYKIPHEFLFEAIRLTDTTEDYLNGANDYLEFDCKLPDKYGSEIEKLYTDKNNFLLCHTIGIGNYLYARFACKPTEQTFKVRDLIFKNGLRCSTQDDNCISSIVRTTAGTQQEKSSFLELLIPTNKVLISIPKDVLNGQNNVPIWGANVAKPSQENPDFILPQYVIGFVNCDKMEIEHNPIPENQRTQYEFKFLDGSTQPFLEKVL